jgi:hypothetical protein
MIVFLHHLDSECTGAAQLNPSANVTTLLGKQNAIRSGYHIVRLLLCLLDRCFLSRLRRLLRNPNCERLDITLLVLPNVIV